MAAATGCLGIVDWGIGGLGLLGLLDDLAPGLPVVYWSDSGSVPYGLQRPAGLASRLHAVVADLADRGCTEVVLACNAASTVVGSLGDAPIPIEGIIEHGIAAVPDSVGGVVGVVGGARTIRSGRYRRGLARSGREVRSRIAQPLSAHIEGGRTHGPAFAGDLQRILAPLRGADAVVLACTHYPAAAPAFAEALPGTCLLDPAVHLASAIAARHPGGRGGGGSRAFVTTGDPDAMRRTAAAAWAMELPPVEQVRPVETT